MTDQEQLLTPEERYARHVRITATPAQIERGNPPLGWCRFDYSEWPCDVIVLAARVAAPSDVDAARAELDAWFDGKRPTDPRVAAPSDGLREAVLLGADDILKGRVPSSTFVRKFAEDAAALATTEQREGPDR